MGGSYQRAGTLTHWEFDMKLVQRFLKDESGATAIEYGLIAAGISVVILTVVTQIGTRLTAKFQAIANALI
jgi:pilus assembly protein Flp/PilA